MPLEEELATLWTSMWVLLNCQQAELLCLKRAATVLEFSSTDILLSVLLGEDSNQPHLLLGFCLNCLEGGCTSSRWVEVRSIPVLMVATKTAMNSGYLVTSITSTKFLCAWNNWYGIMLMYHCYKDIPMSSNELPSANAKPQWHMLPAVHLTHSVCFCSAINSSHFEQ